MRSRPDQTAAQSAASAHLLGPRRQRGASPRGGYRTPHKQELAALERLVRLEKQRFPEMVAWNRGQLITRICFQVPV